MKIGTDKLLILTGEKFDKLVRSLNTRSKQCGGEDLLSTGARKELLGDVMHGFRQVTNIARGDTSHGNSAILSEVDGVVLDDVAHLLSGHASEAEHSNLVSDVLPVVRAALLGKSFPQGCPHTDDPVCHCLYVLHPLLPQGRVGHHLSSDPCAVAGRVGVQWPDNDLDLRLHPGGLLLVLALHSEGSSPFAVETHVLGEALGQENSVALVNKKA